MKKNLDQALAIKRCLEQLAEEAHGMEMTELGDLIALAALAAADAAGSLMLPYYHNGRRVSEMLQ
ncbi:MAG: hypothetical protein O3A96_09075 [Proteobacteria bacterium]|nr:hypothetical protein [Pseudomonadota bacterium]